VLTVFLTHKNKTVVATFSMVQQDNAHGPWVHGHVFRNGEKAPASASIDAYSFLLHYESTDMHKSFTHHGSLKVSIKTSQKKKNESTRHHKIFM
jgi:hypothetical protein